jgi:hypothetical protein
MQIVSTCVGEVWDTLVLNPAETWDYIQFLWEEFE